MFVPVVVVPVVVPVVVVPVVVPVVVVVVPVAVPVVKCIGLLRFFTINVNYFDSSKRDMESHLRRVNKLKSMLQYVMFNYYLLMIKMNRIYKLKNNFII